MRKINPYDFHLATRTTSREINRSIVLNLVREHQPISRADIARRMQIGRGVITKFVGELLAEGLIYEGDTSEAARGRKPTSLYVRTHDRLVVAADVRLSRTHFALGDFSGKQLACDSFVTSLAPAEFARQLAEQIAKLLKKHRAMSRCEGIGVVVPGVVERQTGRIVSAPTLGWSNVDFGALLAAHTKLPVHIENAPKACALSKLWLGRGEITGRDNFVYVSISDGIGVGVVVGGALLRGDDHIAGEFGHVPLSLNGPRCTCGANGCWEAYASNIATLSRYYKPDSFGRAARDVAGDAEMPTIDDLIARARAGDRRAVVALQTTARYLGLGLSIIINALNPSRIYVGGEITAAWDLLEETVRAALAERTLIAAAARTLIEVEPSIQHPRLLGAAALVAAPAYAAPRVA